MMIRPAVGAGMVVALLVVAGASAASATPDPRTTESQITTWQNEDRTARGIATLRTSTTLVRIARAHAERMASAHSVWHQQDLADVVPPWTELGDNVARGPANEEIYGEFRSSEWHQTNIVDPAFELAGVGAAVADDDTLYVAVIFFTPERTVTTPPRITHGPRLLEAPPALRVPATHHKPAVLSTEAVSMVVELASIVEGEEGVDSRLVRDRVIG